MRLLGNQNGTSPSPDDNVNAAQTDAIMHHSPVARVWLRRKFVILAAVLGLVGGGVYTLVASPVYTTQSRIVAAPNKPRAIINNEGVADPSQTANMYTELSIIGSTTILSDALALLEDPQWYWDNGYEVLLNGEKTRNTRVLLQGRKSRPEDRLPMPSGSQIIPLKTFEGQSRLTSIRRNLRVIVGKEDQVITATFDSKYAAEAPIILNAIVSAYMNFTYGQIHNSADEVVRTLQEKKEEFQREIDVKNQAIADVLRQNPMFYLNDGKSNPIQQRLDAVSQQLTLANVELLNARRAYEDAARDDIKSPERLKELLDTGMLDGTPITAGKNEQEMTQEIRWAETQWAEIRRIYMDGHPSAQAAKHRLDEVNASYVLFLKHEYDAKQETVALFQKSFDDAHKAAEELGAKLVAYNAMISDRQNTEKLMQSLDTRMKEINVDSGAGLNLEVLEPAAEPTSPSRPIPLLVMFEGLVLGLLGGTAGTFLDRRLRSVDEITTAIAMPMLGVVPRMSRRLNDVQRGRLVLTEPLGDVAEAFRAIRSSVVVGSKARTILVTSAVRTEGKSTVTSNVALALAEAGYRVLLIDADLRKPVQQQIFALESAIGLSQVLEEKATVDQAIVQTPIDGLDLMPCGQIPENPGELMDTRSFPEILAALSERYQYVVIDSPPVLPVADARILASMTDATLLVVRAEKANRRATIDARDGLLILGANLLGVVINDTPRNRNTYGYYGGYGLHRDSLPVQPWPVKALLTDNSKATRN